MTQVFEEQKLTSVGDFMLSAQGDNTIVKIVTGQDYAGPGRSNEHLSGSSLNQVVSSYNPHVEEYSPQTVIGSLDAEIVRYEELAARCKYIDNISFARNSVKRLATAKSEIQQLNLKP